MKYLKFILYYFVVKWAGYVERMGGGKMHTGFWWGNLGEGDHLEDSDVDGRIILKWIFDRWDEGHELNRPRSG